MCRLYVRQKIQAGLKDVESADTLPVSEVQKIRIDRMRVDWTRNAIPDLTSIYEQIESDSQNYTVALVDRSRRTDQSLCFFDVAVQEEIVMPVRVANSRSSPRQRKPLGNTLVQSLDRIHNFLRIDILEIRVVALAMKLDLNLMCGI